MHSIGGGGSSYLRGELLGEGTFGSVFRAEDTSSGLIYAVKRVKAHSVRLAKMMSSPHTHVNGFNVDLVQILPRYASYDAYARYSTHISSL